MKNMVKKQRGKIFLVIVYLLVGLISPAFLMHNINVLAWPLTPPLTPPAVVGNLAGRVFVDNSPNGRNNLLRSANERVLRYNDSPQVFVKYQLQGTTGWTFASNASTAGVSDGPYSVFGLTPGKYNIHAYINVGPGWAFSEPEMNKLAVIPWPVNGADTFNDGERISGNYCTKRVSNYCTEIKIINNPKVEIKAGETFNLWFGVRPVPVK